MMRMRRRLEFSPATKRAALERAGGVCECHRVPELMKILRDAPCGRPLGTGNTEFHHVIADAIRPDNSLDNCAALTRTCHSIVTPRDRKLIAQAKRRSDRHHGIRPTPRQFLLGTFRSGVTKGFDGIPRWRDSRRQWPAPRDPQPELNASEPQPVQLLAVPVHTVEGI